MSRYAIWNKQDDVFTPSGKMFTSSEWKDKYPISKLDSVKVVCAGGAVNGAFFGILSEMIDMYTKAGCDFSACETDQDFLNAIEAFEDERNKPSDEISTEERTAAALEFIAMNSLPDEEIV